jgi:hypothetical protein
VRLDDAAAPTVTSPLTSHRRRRAASCYRGFSAESAAGVLRAVPGWDTFATVDRAAPAAVRLPPVARLARRVACVVLALLGGFPAPADARALPPPPERVAAVWGRPGWSAAAGVTAGLPLARLGGQWAGGGPVALPTALRSLYG